ncbi:putative disease resistance protein RDL6 [Apostasia shenzhenica]|uniref:Putative disease resistance protein RDL6 n=1 Tax=Apostasia shenzhenica TaxID=1088818 RepID=A0A2I0ADD4_9ASPA|nr:putative disease resistance protein RDL6 [Apostasia shenzhenica]
MLNLHNMLPLVLPAGIWKMHQLRHLNILCFNLSPNSQIHRLKILRSLSTVLPGSCLAEGLEVLGNLKRELSIRGDLDPYKNALQNSIGGLKSLRSLTLDCHSSVPSFGRLSNHIYLYKILLYGRLDSLPRSDDFPPNLTKMILGSSRLERDPMPILEKLRNLQVLKLSWSAFRGKKWLALRMDSHD